MGLKTDQVIAAFTSATPSGAADYDVLTVGTGDLRIARLAVSRNGFPSLLVPVPSISKDTTRLTSGVAVSAATSVEFARGMERWRCSAAVVECREPTLVRTFAALVAAIVTRLEAGPAPSWATVQSLLAEWERLLGRRRVLAGEAELGLWGELWCVARSARTLTLLEGWRGPDAERVDFFLDGLAVEVKTGRRQGVHMVSHAQVADGFGDAAAFFMSMHVMTEPLRGRSLPDLVRDASERLDDVATLEEKLASVGYARDDDGAYATRYVLVEAPLFYRRADVPRVRVADAGVSDLRYRVELPRDAALNTDERSGVVEVLGLNEQFAREYPCA